MAKFEKAIYGDFNGILQKIEQGVLNGSASATQEDSSDYVAPGARCSVRVFERYSYMGGNRVSMSVTLFQAGNGPVQICGITSGGSQAMLWKINTIGEESFLRTLEELFQ